MPWPAHADYQEAVQNPRICFRDGDLKSAQIHTDPIGRPLVWTGNFAAVYRSSLSGTILALRCFSREMGDLEERYRRITPHLISIRERCPYFVSYRYRSAGIMVRGAGYPLMRMAWVPGDSLGSFLEKNLDRPPFLLQMATSLSEMVGRLEQAGVAHGDLSLENICIGSDAPKLIDYDGMFVPSLAGWKSCELGNSAFQHPHREARHFGVGLDRFSVLVIGTALIALAADPSLYGIYGRGAGLLFSSADLRDPKRSELFRILCSAAEPTVRRLACELASWCCQELELTRTLPNLRGIRVERAAIARPIGRAGAPIGGGEAGAQQVARSGVMSAAPWWVEHQRLTSTPAAVNPPPSPTPVVAPPIPRSAPTPTPVSGPVRTAASPSTSVPAPTPSTRPAVPPVPAGSCSAPPTWPRRPWVVPSAPPAPAVSCSVPRAAVGGSTATGASSPAVGPVVASRNGKVYHHLNCAFANRIAARNGRAYQTAAAAAANGLRPCSHCCP